MSRESFLPEFGMVNESTANEEFLPVFGMADESSGVPEPPPGATGMAVLMRHGTWFGSGVKQRMWWAK